MHKVSTYIGGIPYVSQTTDGRCYLLANILIVGAQ